MSRYEDTRPSGRDARKRSASPSRSPARKRRPLAADYFDDADANPRGHREHGDGRLRPSGHQQSHRDRDRGDDDHSRKRRHHHKYHHHKDHASSSKRKDPVPAELPFKARPLSYKYDLDVFEPLFANYLDIQKGKDFYGLDGHEQKGRWKSFVNKWNSGELAEGWYDPEMFERIVKEAPARPDARRRDESAVEEERGHDFEMEDAEEGTIPPRQEPRNNGEENDDDDDYGPPPPPGTSSLSRKGPGIPSLSDLALQREALAEDRLAHVTDLRVARKADRLAQKEALDELVPRAEPGTRERKLEKKAAVNDKMRSFRDKGDAMEEVDDGELMGGGDGVAEFKRAVASQQRKKTDRELRREEDARARFEEREERLKEWREREEEKMRGLKELAKARFG